MRYTRVKITPRIINYPNPIPVNSLFESVSPVFHPSYEPVIIPNIFFTSNVIPVDQDVPFPEKLSTENEIDLSPEKVSDYNYSPKSATVIAPKTKTANVFAPKTRLGILNWVYNKNAPEVEVINESKDVVKYKPSFIDVMTRLTAYSQTDYRWYYEMLKARQKALADIVKSVMED